METETVDLASAPFENLIGKPISDSFWESNTFPGE